MQNTTSSVATRQGTPLLENLPLHSIPDSIHKDNFNVFDCGPGGLEIRFSERPWYARQKMAFMPDDQGKDYMRFVEAWTEQSHTGSREWERHSIVRDIPVDVLHYPGDTIRPASGWTAGSSANYEAHRMANAKEAKKKVRRLVRKYFQVIYMWTLTFKKNLQDVGECDRLFRAAMRAMKTYYAGRGQTFYYLAVREFQKRGAVHYHVFINCYLWKPKRLPAYYGMVGHAMDWAADEELRLDCLNHQGQKSIDDFWPHGFTWVSTNIKKRKNGTDREEQVRYKARRDYDRLAAYLTKYITKALEPPEVEDPENPSPSARLRGRHLYLRSQGLFVEKASGYSTVRQLLVWLQRGLGRKVIHCKAYPVTLSWVELDGRERQDSFNVWRIDSD